MLKICRTCLEETPDISFVVLNNKVQVQLLACVPELELHLVKDPVICRNCVSILELAYDFKTRCLFTEKQIRSRIRIANLNGLRVTLTKLFSVSTEASREKTCYAARDLISGTAVSARLPVKPCGPALDMEDDYEPERSSRANGDSNVVMNSDVSTVNREESEFENVATNSGAITGLTVHPLELRDKVLEWPSAAACTDIIGEISQDLHTSVEVDIVKEECDLSTFKIEADEALSIKKENVYDEGIRSNDCKTANLSEVSHIAVVADGEYKFPVPTRRDGENFEVNNSKNLRTQTNESYVCVEGFCTDSEYSCELYSACTATSDANITESSVKKRRVNCENKRTNSCSTSSLRKGDNAYTVSRNENSQEMSDTDEDSITKKEHERKIFKTNESFNEKNFKGRTVNVDVPIKECFVKLQRLHLFDLLKKSSFNTNELLNLTLAKSLQTTYKKPESVRRKGNKHLNKHDQAHSTKKSFCCKVCKYSTTLKGNLVKHMRIHTGEKPFQCNVCDFRTVHKQSLIIHMRSHNGEKPFQCNVCKYRTIHKQNLTNHMRTHTGEKPFRCNVCDVRLTQKGSLARHMRTHTGEKPFQCNICDFGTVRKQNVIRHMQTHTEEKPLQCNVCDYRAVNKQNLSNHMRTHTGEKPFQCNICDFRTVHKQNVIRHMQTHTGEKPLQCNVCDYSTAHKQNLTNHMRTHTGEKPFRSLRVRCKNDS